SAPPPPRAGGGAAGPPAPRGTCVFPPPLGEGFGGVCGVPPPAAPPPTTPHEGPAMRTPRLPCPVLLLLLAAASPAFADELLPPTKSIEEVVDHYVEARLQQENVTPAPQAEDANLVRRL